MDEDSSPMPGTSPGRITTPVRRRSSHALQRKRERDKQSQRNKRAREREYIANLEAKLRELEAAKTLVHHAHSEVQSSLANHRRHSDIEPGIIPQALQPPKIRSSASVDRPAVTSPALTLPSPSTISIPDSHAPVNTLEARITVSSDVLSTLLSTPEWHRVPQWNVARPSEGYRFLTRGQGFASLKAQLRTSKDMEASCPPVPKVMDLLFGGSHNLLANFVFSELAQMPFLTPEKFGACTLIYTYLRWLVWPSSESYQRLPECLRPTMLQLTQEHHLSFDFLLWPQIRDNLIKHGHRYELEGVMGLMCCTLRLRGSFGTDFIYRQNGEEPQVKDDFYRQIFDTSNWGILSRFWEVSAKINYPRMRALRKSSYEYPYLMEDMDSCLLLREENLIPSS